jgi:hypothetical protein
MAAQDSLHPDWTTIIFSSQADFQLTTDLVLIWMAAYIAYRYPKKCLLNTRIHGYDWWFHSSELVSKNLHLSFTYPRKRVRQIVS